MANPTVSDTVTSRKPMSLPRLIDMHTRGEKIAMLTCYDASFASLLDRCGVDVALIGDSLGMVLQGHESTLPVTMEQIVYHVQCVARANRHMWIVADMPFGSYHESPAQAYANAARLLQAGAHMVKLEGGTWLADTIGFLVARGISVCGHVGLTPQSVHALGGYRVQGKSEVQAAQLQEDVHAIVTAGASMVVFEMVPAPLAAAISAATQVPTIGIGAGASCSGQVLVLHDMLGIYPGRKARFVRNFMEGGATIDAAVIAYVQAVREGSFPAEPHTY